ncbi:sugar phosphate isomerase/epimerase [Paenibacillus sp. BSR1-1]|uniref:sugar phosphate isomerase/epimerase family protein n=1 Tax=Paenibacillus sp. BSR1-1 TaxID=3020845 RepID=UPI0025B08F77|nr:sugar phosphate isomerase/epimerase family protein [Paenibacillus sp. BSR1-1]MDN3019411.1 sugar phosphate isomerase/epimerase [Paenibacillus sp. BSR1-1]
MIKYSYNTLVFAGEDIETGIARLAKFGYDGVEIVGEPEKMDANRIKELLDQYNIEASTICAIYNTERDLVSSNENIRKNAVEYIKSCVDFASTIGAKGISLTPTACMKIYGEADRETELNWAVEGIREAGFYAGEHGVRLTVEAWNRYENYLINRLEQALELVNRVNLPNVGVMGDTYHMNIEEVDIADTIRMVGDKLYHLHIADSNRAAPGRGHIDFEPIAQALRDINYSGFLTMELLPPFADPFNGSKCEEFYDQYSEESITFLKNLFKEEK